MRMCLFFQGRDCIEKIRRLILKYKVATEKELKVGAEALPLLNFPLLRCSYLEHSLTRYEILTKISTCDMCRMLRRPLRRRWRMHSQRPRSEPSFLKIFDVSFACIVHSMFVG